MAKIIVESAALDDVAASFEMYADILDYIDENDIADVEEYAELIRQSAATIHEIVEHAEQVEGDQTSCQSRKPRPS